MKLLLSFRKCLFLLEVPTVRSAKVSGKLFVSVFSAASPPPEQSQLPAPPPSTDEWPHLTLALQETTRSMRKDKKACTYTTHLPTKWFQKETAIV